MAKTAVPYTRYFDVTMRRMREDGLLLVTAGSEGRPNAMTIGWGMIGSIWGRPLFLVLVRPSRHSYGLLEQRGDFTVNVPPQALAAALSHCGTVSGRDHDKFAELGLTARPARQVQAPVIEECAIHYECRTIERNDIDPETLAQGILDDAYAKDDYHRVYYGEIVACYADAEAAEALRGSALPVRP
jgi:flavin reductase (DIM6/NTAB) family NADH-FMN oxidoreductase RutF